MDTVKPAQCISLVLDGNKLDLEVDTQWQVDDGDAGSGWLVGVEVGGVDLVELGEVGHVLQEDVDLDDVFQLGVGVHDNGQGVLEHLVGLGLDVTLDRLPVWGVRDLAADVDKAVGSDGVGVAGGSRRCVLGVDRGDFGAHGSVELLGD